MQHARELGFHHFHVEMTGGNVRMLGLLRERISPLQTRIQHGLTRVDFEMPIGR